MPLGSLNTDLVRKKSMKTTVNFQDTRNLVKIHLAISQVQHENSYSKNATNVPFFFCSHPYLKSCQCPMCWSEFRSAHPTPKETTSRVRMLLLVYHHKSIFTEQRTVLLGRQQIQNLSQYFKIIHVQGSQQCALNIFREALVMSIFPTILGLRRAKSSQKLPKKM